MKPGGSALATLAAQMPPGTWAELPTNGLTNQLLTDIADYSYITQYSEDLAWDPISRQLLFVGGPHTGQVKFITYNEATNTWRAEPRPSFWNCAANELWGLCRGHAYDHLAINAAAGKLYFRHFNSAVISQYDIATTAWSRLPDMPANVFAPGTCCGALEYFQEMNGLVAVMGAFGEVGLYTPANNQWRQLGSGVPMGGYTNFLEYNPVHKVMIFGGGWGSGSRKALHKLDATGAITRLNDHPFDQLGSSQSIVTVDPVSGRYLVFGKIGDQPAFYEYEVTTDSWRLQPASRRPPFFDVGADGPLFGTVATPISTYGVTAFLNYDRDNSKLYLYKHAPLTAQSAPAAGADFATRCNDPNVVRCYGFDEAADLAPRMYDPWGGPTRCTNNRCWVVDTAIKASGAGSLRFEIPSNTGADTSGSFWLNFKDDLSVQFGGNEQFFIQWRQRFSSEFLTTRYAGGGGWKQAIIGTGDQPGRTYYSCSDLEVVTVNNYYRGFAQMYNSCSGSTSHGPFDGFEEPFGAYDFKLQNARPAPYCLYSQTHTNPPTSFPPTGNCFGYFANEWMTFQVGITLGPRVNDEFINSAVQLWIAREGQPAELVINWGPYNLTAGPPNENQRFGKVWLLPYNTGKDASQSHPVAYTWYDDLIISRSRIADPDGAAPPPPLTQRVYLPLVRR
jgi:hypothetical protein